MQQSVKQYYQILEAIVLNQDDDPYVIEQHLTNAFDLGRTLIDRQVSPDELTQIHHLALVELAKRHPLLKFAEIAERLSKPFIQMSMVYGMAFRVQLEREHQVVLDSRVEQTRMEAVGMMAAGIAHDFNNILGSIVGYTELASDELAEGSQGRQNLQQVLTGAFRAKDIVLRLLTFARQIPTQATEVELVSQIEEALGLLNVSYRPNLEFVFCSGFPKAWILADLGQCQQIVMNLCINAADAMNLKGTVLVALASATLYSNGSNKPAICLTVADRGHGIPPEVRKRMYMPFYTTKPPNKGSGLGLSVVYGIVFALGGKIEVDSHTEGSERGTKFSITLPILAKNAEQSFIKE